MFEASNNSLAEHRDSQIKEDGHSLLAPIQLHPARTLQSQSNLSQNITSAKRLTLSPLSPPLSHTRSPSSLPCSQLEFAQRHTWSLPPHTPPSPRPKLPWCSPFVEQSYRQQLSANPTLPRVHDPRGPPKASVEWKPIPTHPDGTNLDEIISLMHSEIILHNIREKYKEAIARRLLARYNAMFARRQRETLELQSRIECRQGR